MQTKSITILIGYIGTDPVSKDVSGKVVTTFTVATEENWKDDQGEKKSRTEWHNIEMWGNQNLVQYLKKGTPIHVQGRNRTDEYEKPVGGEQVKMKRTKIVVDEIGLLDSKGGKGEEK